MEDFEIDGEMAMLFLNMMFLIDLCIAPVQDLNGFVELVGVTGHFAKKSVMFDVRVSDVVLVVIFEVCMH